LWAQAGAKGAHLLAERRRGKKPKPGGERDRQAERAGAGVSRASSHGVRQRHGGCYPHGGGCSTAALELSAAGAAARAGAPTLQLSAAAASVTDQANALPTPWFANTRF